MQDLIRTLLAELGENPDREGLVNTPITEGPDGRIFEVTNDGTIVWEYVFPLFTPRNSVYRAYRVPYEWIPQINRPQERAVTPPSAGEYRVP